MKKATSTVIKTWLGNQGQKSRDCGPIIVVDNTSKEFLDNFLELVKKQFPNNKSYVNDNTDEMFISIEK